MTRACLAALAFTLAAVPVRAEVYRVGPGGTHATIQSALDAALAAGGENEVRIAAGTWMERPVIEDLLADGDHLTVSGGWGAAFEERTEEATVVDGGGRAPVWRVRVTGGTLTLLGMTWTGGSVVDAEVTPVYCISEFRRDTDVWDACPGGGLALLAKGTARVEMQELMIHENHLWAPPDFNALGGSGMNAVIGDQAAVYIATSGFEHNSLASADGWVGSQGIGLSAFLTGTAGLEIAESTFVENDGVGDEGQSYAGGAYISAHLDSGTTTGRIVLRDNLFLGNQAHFGPALLVSGLNTEITIEDNRFEDNINIASSVAGLRLGAAGSGSNVRARRNAFIRNSGGVQVELVAYDDTRIDFSDSLIAEGGDDDFPPFFPFGTGIRVAEEGVVNATNLTIVGNPGRGFYAYPSATVHLSNTILFGNGTDEPEGDIIASHNLVGIDPHFIDPAADNYRLEFDSSAVDAGDDDPPGGLSSSDLDGNARLRGRSVDIGAYETPGSDGFCRVRSLTGVALDLTWVPVCRCLRDEILRDEFHCGFFLPDLFLAQEIPVDWQPGAPVGVDWTIDPWRPVAGPYTMAAEARIGGQWVPQQWLGPGAGGLTQGKLVREKFRLQLPNQGRTPVRTGIEYRRPGAKEPVRAVVEVLMPEPGGRGKHSSPKEQP